MNIKLYDYWKNEKIIAGYSTDFDGAFGYNIPENAENYSAVASGFGLKAENMIRVHQKHTAEILNVTAENGGEGVIREGTSDFNDGLITASENVMLCVVTADCVPVFLFDEKKEVIGMVHSGRVGTIKEISYFAVKKMTEKYGSDPQDIKVILGPYLSEPHHEVNPEDVTGFYERFTKDECAQFLRNTEKKSYVDMGRAIVLSLKRAGVKEANIVDERVCTFENRELYSWRREHNPAARNLSFICIRK